MRHIKDSKTHKKYVLAQNDVVTVSLTSPKLKSTIERKSCITKEDAIVRKKMLFSFLRAGIPLRKLDAVRESIESISNQKLCNSGDIWRRILKYF